MKNFYLNNYVFPSMANVIAFFDYVGSNQELCEDFEDDIKEILYAVGPDSSPYYTIVQQCYAMVMKRIRIILDSYYLSRYRGS